MIYFVIQCTLSGIIIAEISEAAKRSFSFGALIASLPLLSLLGILWLWRDTGDVERIASQAEATFWYVIPSLPMFLILPAMLRAGVGFWSSMAVGCVLTTILYFVTARGWQKFGINIQLCRPTGKSLPIYGSQCQAPK
jgi:hypothetical protein